MVSFLLRVDDVLRQRQRTPVSARPRREMLHLVLIVVVFAAAYGAVLGSFRGIADGRALQIVYAAIKVPMLLLATSAVAMPSFFVLNSLFGLRSDFGAAVRALVSAQAALAIVLAALAPLTAVWYLSCDDYTLAILFNAMMFAVASFAAQGLLRAAYRPLIRHNPKHRGMLWTWLVIYMFVGIQMGWMLRPFVGSAGIEVQFFREGAWGNAYIVVARLIFRAIAALVP